jgi:hypothetical protein
MTIPNDLKRWNTQQLRGAYWERKPPFHGLPLLDADCIRLAFRWHCRYNDPNTRQIGEAVNDLGLSRYRPVIGSQGGFAAGPVYRDARYPLESVDAGLTQLYGYKRHLPRETRRANRAFQKQIQEIAERVDQSPDPTIRAIEELFR